VAQTVTIGEQKVCSESESLKFSATPTPQVENPSYSNFTALDYSKKISEISLPMAKIQHFKFLATFFLIFGQHFKFLVGFYR